MSIPKWIWITLCVPLSLKFKVTTKCKSQSSDQKDPKFPLFSSKDSLLASNRRYSCKYMYFKRTADSWLILAKLDSLACKLYNFMCWICLKFYMFVDVNYKCTLWTRILSERDLRSGNLHEKYPFLEICSCNCSQVLSRDTCVHVMQHVREYLS